MPWPRPPALKLPPDVVLLPSSSPPKPVLRRSHIPRVNGRARGGCGSDHRCRGTAPSPRTRRCCTCFFSAACLKYPCCDCSGHRGQERQECEKAAHVAPRRSAKSARRFVQPCAHHAARLMIHLLLRTLCHLSTFSRTFGRCLSPISAARSHSCYALLGDPNVPISSPFTIIVPISKCYSHVTA